MYAEERGTNEYFFEAAMVLTYAWNASPIDGICIIQNVPAIGRELKFRLDIELQETPTPNEQDSEALVDYIRHLGRDIPFV